MNVGCVVVRSVGDRVAEGVAVEKLESTGRDVFEWLVLVGQADGEPLFWYRGMVLVVGQGADALEGCQQTQHSAKPFDGVGRLKRNLWDTRQPLPLIVGDAVVSAVVCLDAQSLALLGLNIETDNAQVPGSLVGP